MNRREFLESGSLAGAGLFGRGIAGGSAVVLGGALIGMASSAKAAGYWTESQNLNNLKMASEFSMREYAKEFPDMKTSKEFSSQLGEVKFSEIQRSRSNDWIKRAFSFAESALAEIPPSFEESPEREGALMILDYPSILDDKTKNTPQSAKDAWMNAMKEVYGNRCERLKNFLEEPAPSEGVDIFKLYNMGVILKSSGECIAIDFRSQYGIPFSPTDIELLVKSVDALFITHFHADHTDIALIEALLKAGKNVFAPDPKAISKDLAEKYPNNFVEIYSEGGERIVQIGSATVRMFGGHQGKGCLNNVYLLEMGGLKLVHTGDNANINLYDKIGSEHKVDVLMPALWERMISVIARTRPSKVIPLHELELGHQPHARVEHRWAYDQISYMKLTDPEQIKNLQPGMRVQVEEFKSVWNKELPKFTVLTRGEKVRVLPQ